jgi:hypothetical protein
MIPYAASSVRLDHVDVTYYTDINFNYNLENFGPQIRDQF